jgi:hypothetical protein
LTGVQGLPCSKSKGWSLACLTRYVGLMWSLLNIVCYDEVGLCAQNVFTSLGSVVSTVGRPMQLHRKRTLPWIAFVSQLRPETEISDLQLLIR